MSRFEPIARTAWAEMAPAALAQLEDPEAFFQGLAGQAEQAWEALAAQLAGQDPPGETYLARVGRLNSARARATEIVIHDYCLPPEPEQDPADLETVPDPDPEGIFWDRVIRQARRDPTREALDPDLPMSKAQEMLLAAMGSLRPAEVPGTSQEFRDHLDQVALAHYPEDEPEASIARDKAALPGWMAKYQAGTLAWTQEDYTE